MDILFDVYNIIKKLEIASKQFSGEKYQNWSIGSTDDVSKTEIFKRNKGFHLVECNSPKVAETVLISLENKGIHVHSRDAAGKWIYMYQH